MAKKKLRKKIILAGIPNQFWQLHKYIENSRKAGSIIEEFSTQKAAIRYAKRHKLKIIKIESHR